MELLNIFIIIVAILLIIVIVFQQRGGGLSSVFGGSDSVFQVKRGAEKFIFIATIILSILFFGLLIVRLFIK